MRLKLFLDGHVVFILTRVHFAEVKVKYEIIRFKIILRKNSN
jgi:hypothetical protein